MGCSMFFVAMATYPDLQSKIETMVALAPATSLAHMTSPIFRLAPFIKPIEVGILYLIIIYLFFKLYLY
jgi:lysosomal acid lipase/cholesteryl ester hydrolase